MRSSMKSKRKHTKTNKKKSKKYIQTNKKKYRKKKGGENGVCNLIQTKKEIVTIVNKLLMNKSKNENPVAVIMVGGPGSGKTNAQREAINQLNLQENDFLVVNPDYFIENVFNNDNDCYYDQALQEKLKTNNNYDGYDADLATKLLLQYGIAARINIVLDGTGRVYNGTTRDMKLLKDNGYTVVICINYIDYDIAIERIKQRELNSARKVDIPYVEKTYTEINQNIPRYANLDYKSVDRVFMFNNNGETMKIMLDLTFEKNGQRIINCYDSCEFLTTKFGIQ